MAFTLNPTAPATQSANIGATSTYDPSVIAGSNTAQGLAEQQAATPYSSLATSDAVAPMSGNQQLGYNAAQASAPLIAQNNSTLGSSWTNPGTQAQYMSPYENSVLKAQQAYATQAQSQQVAAQKTREGMNNSFGGSGAAIGDAQELQNYNLNSNAMEATGLQGAYSAGQQQFNTAQNTALASNNQEYGALASTGSVAQNIAQSADNYNVTNYNNALNWAGTQAKQLAGVLNTMPKNSASTRDTTSTSSGSGISNLSGLGGLVGMGMTLAGGNGNQNPSASQNTAAASAAGEPAAGTVAGPGDYSGINGGTQASEAAAAAALTTGNNGADTWGSSASAATGNGGLGVGTPSPTSDSGYQNLSGLALADNSGMTNPIGALQSMGMDSSSGADTSGFSSDPMAG